MPPFLLSLLPRILPLVLAAVVAGACVGWITHKVDAAAYVSLQLADANALNEQMTKDQEAAQAFNMRAATAMEATAAKLKTLAAQRVNQTQNLINTFTAEGSKDASLAACMAMPIPASILQQFPR